MQISIEQIKELREQTGVSIMQCKKALEEAGGDIQKAKIALTKKSGEIAAKKKDRELASGTVLVCQNGSEAVILELACETDFVANNQDFKDLAKSLGEMILQEGIEDAGDERIQTKISEAVQKFGERIELSRFQKVSEPFGHYTHSNASVAAVVSFSSKLDETLAKDLAMHVAAQNPKYLKAEDIDEEEKVKAEETLKQEVQDKPEEMREKILEGKMNAFFKERVLLSQSFIKDPSKSVSDVLLEGVEIVSFMRYAVGEE